ncbi:hypothetical protein GcM3_165021 [Golovinomyces cichoracearum]|uniref:Uncharacterized protein n=1 Tax=Golovinomyces cichoracearum TaxID=62708 RepID=A0A420HSU7_9PEZI|nr:hypothetical protein GcM3_165021 [Golovinomyces cichoracearum]
MVLSLTLIPQCVDGTYQKLASDRRHRVPDDFPWHHINPSHGVQSIRARSMVGLHHNFDNFPAAGLKQSRKLDKFEMLLGHVSVANGSHLFIFGIH